MTTEIKMPQLGESVTEGTIGRWLKQPGDSVAKYEPLLEVITDKVDSEVPAPSAGTLLEILVAEGQTVPVGTVIARLGTAQPTASTPVTPAPVTAAVQAMPTEPVQVKRFLSPVVQRMLAEHKLDPATITGTGRHGRITRQDLLRVITAQAALPPAPVAPPAPPPAPVAPPAPPPAPVAPPAPPPLSADSELLPLSPMRRSIAEHMERSVRTAPHVTTVMEVDLSRVVAHRTAHQNTFARQGVRLTYTPYFVLAAASALRQVPIMNGSFSTQGILLNRQVHIGVAVALDEGLLVPVIRDADEKNLLGLARAVGDLSARARARRLQPDETQGGTFTITNHGVSGSIFATPIINQPQAAILGIGAMVKRPVVISHGGDDSIAIRPICYLSLTFDHRITDGATADGFLQLVKQVLESYA